MQTEPLNIPGIAGPVVVTANAITGKHTLTVNGQPATAMGRRAFALPTTDGQTVEASVKSTLVDPYPTVTIAGTQHRTGPVVPIALRILTLLPIALIIGGLLGGLLGAFGVAANVGIVRSSLTTAVKAVLMIAVFGVTAVVWLILAAMIQTAVNS